MRKLLYQALASEPLLVPLVGNRIIQASALGNPELPGYEGIPETPFLTYRMHTEFPFSIGRREYAQVWANDAPGDYGQIDDILEIARKAVEAIPSQDNFIQAVWIETGVDLKDDAMSTINRYIRFQFTGSLRDRE